MTSRVAMIAVMLSAAWACVGAAQDPPWLRASGDSVAADFTDADLRVVVQAFGRFLPKPVVASGVPADRISLETPAPLPRTQVLELLRGLIEAHGLEIVEEPAFFRVRPRAPVPLPRPPEGLPETGPLRDQGAVQLHVIRLRHARATDVAATVNLLFGGPGEFSGAPGLGGGTLSDQLREARQPPANAPPGAPTRTGNLAGPTTLIPDDLTNSLLIRATVADFALINEAVEELDIRPLQVLIEVLIVEARSDRNFSLGADIFVPPHSIDAGDGTAEGTLTGGGLADLVIKVLNLGSANVNATIRAAASRGNVRIISRPVLLASNNSEARLLVGSQRPFVEVSRSLPTQVPTRDQVVQYRDVGTRLVVRPTVNHDGYVNLQVQQEVNQATEETQFDAPVISTREASTRVLVHDGQTIVIGGLRDQQRDRSSGGVPFLSSLPLIGGLFGHASRRDTATELYLFLTPRILRTDADADSVTTPRLPEDVRR
jgi:general secretion pathway protein D